MSNTFSICAQKFLTGLINYCFYIKTYDWYVWNSKKFQLQKIWKSVKVKNSNVYNRILVDDIGLQWLCGKLGKALGFSLYMTFWMGLFYLFVDSQLSWICLFLQTFWLSPNRCFLKPSLVHSQHDQYCF